MTAADRGDQTTLLHRFTTGDVPPGTVAIEIEVLFEVEAGLGDGYADNLSLVLQRWEG